MATYAELYSLRSDSSLRNKVAVAVVIAAEGKLTGTPTAEEAAWAVSVISSPNNAARMVTNLVLASNKDTPVANILSASDSVIQTNVDSVIAGLILGEI
jgi:hypothetical protein